MDQIQFGWLPEKTSYLLPALRIEPVSDFDEVLTSVRESGSIERDWFYPPRVGDEPKPAEWFKLPFTHVLQLVDEQIGRHRLSTFLVFVLGFLKGLRLIPEPWVHVYRVPTKVHQLQDFHVYQPAISRVLERALEFWRSRSSDSKIAMVGALHWHALGRTYEHPYEVFNAQYTVLDTCWRIHSYAVGVEPPASHAQRAQILASVYGLDVPEWALVNGKQSYLSRLRNALIHEGLWAGEPIGLAHPNEFPSIHLDLYRFNSRLLLALLGDTSDYVRQPMSWSMTLLD